MPEEGVGYRPQDRLFTPFSLWHLPTPPLLRHSTAHIPSHPSHLRLFPRLLLPPLIKLQGGKCNVDMWSPFVFTVARSFESTEVDPQSLPHQLHWGSVGGFHRSRLMFRLALSPPPIGSRGPDPSEDAMRATLETFGFIRAIVDVRTLTKRHLKSHRKIIISPHHFTIITSHLRECRCTSRACARSSPRRGAPSRGLPRRESSEFHCLKTVRKCVNK